MEALEKLDEAWDGISEMVGNEDFQPMDNKVEDRLEEILLIFQDYLGPLKSRITHLENENQQLLKKTTRLEHFHEKFPEYAKCAMQGYLAGGENINKSVENIAELSIEMAEELMIKTEKRAKELNDEFDESKTS